MATERLLIMLGHAAGLYAADDALEDLRQYLASADSFSAVLGGEWESFVSACQRPMPAGVKCLEDLVDRLLAGRGLWFEDLPGGRCYLHVEPELG